MTLRRQCHKGTHNSPELHTEKQCHKGTQPNPTLCLVQRNNIQACQLGKPKKEENYTLLTPSPSPQNASSIKRVSVRTNINKYINGQKNKQNKYFYIFFYFKWKSREKYSYIVTVSVCVDIHIWECECVCVCVVLYSFLSYSAFNVYDYEVINAVISQLIMSVTLTETTNCKNLLPWCILIKTEESM